MADRETRTLSQPGLELRAEPTSNGWHFTGYAALWDVPYAVSDALGTYRETFKPGAFDRHLKSGADVRLLFNHDGVPLARTASGTMRLKSDSTGLKVDADLDKDSPLAQTVGSALRRGDASQMSHQFSATQQQWSDDYSERDVYGANLYDTSIVTFPANEDTTAQLRDGNGMCLSRLIAVLDTFTRQVRAGAPLDPGTRTLLLQVIGSLDAGAATVHAATEVLEEIAGGVTDDSDQDVVAGSTPPGEDDDAPPAGEKRDNVLPLPTARRLRLLAAAL